MDLINKLLAGFLDSFKAKNPKIYTAIVGVLALIYFGIDYAVNGGLIAGGVYVQVLQGIDLIFLAAVGSKTAPFISQYLNQVSAQQIDAQDNWWTKIIDGFKVKSPVAFFGIATALIGFMVSTGYAVQFDLLPDGITGTLIKVASYVDLAVLILLGSRTQEYLQAHPPLPIPEGSVSGQSLSLAAENRALYFD